MIHKVFQKLKIPEVNLSFIPIFCLPRRIIWDHSNDKWVKMVIKKFWYSSLEALVYVLSVTSGERVTYSFRHTVAQGVADWRNWTISTALCNAWFLGTALKRLSKGQNGRERQVCFPIVLYALAPFQEYLYRRTWSSQLGNEKWENRIRLTR